MTAQALLQEVRQRGFKVVARAGNLVVTPGCTVPEELVTQLRQRKAELLNLLQAQADNLPADCQPWLHIADQILEGEFRDGDRSTFESLEIGLRSIQHPTCQQALARVREALATMKKEP